MNNLSFVGHVGYVQELKDVNGYKVLNFSVAENSYQGKKGQKTTWFQCAIWGDRASALAPWLTVGKQVYISGSLESGDDGNPVTFQKKDGSMASQFRVRVNDLQLMGGGNDQEAVQEPVQTEDDIPF